MLKSHITTVHLLKLITSALLGIKLLTLFRFFHLFYQCPLIFFFSLQDPIQIPHCISLLMSPNLCLQSVTVCQSFLVYHDLNTFEES